MEDSNSNSGGATTKKAQSSKGGNYERVAYKIVSAQGGVFYSFQIHKNDTFTSWKHPLNVEYEDPYDSSLTRNVEFDIIIRERGSKKDKQKPYPPYSLFIKNKELNFANFIGTIVYDKWQLSFERVFKKNEELECGYLDVAPNVELRYKVEFYTGTRQKVVLSEAAAGAETVQPQPLCLENGQGVVEAMEELLEKGTCSDVKIICGGEEIGAHKAVLVARAEYFKSMFTADLVEANTNEVNIQDFDASTIRSLIRYLYTGSITEENIGVNLLAAADVYGVLELKDISEKYLLEKVCESTAIEFLIYAYRHNASSLKTKAVSFLLKNMDSMKERPEWKSLHEEHPVVMADILEIAFSK